MRPRAFGPPNSVALVFLAWIVAIPVFFADRLLNTDGDLASHLFIGRRVLEHGIRIPVDWAFTTPDATFVAYEWLSEVALVGVEWAAGLAGVVALATLLIVGSVALAGAYLRPRVEPFFALPAMFGVAVLTSAHWSARPHLFTFAGLAILLHVGASRGRLRLLWLGLLFAFWANLHPGFLYGLAMYVAYLAGHALDRRSAEAVRTNALSAMAAGAATLLNPLGWGLHANVLHHLSDRAAFDLVDEFAAPGLDSVYGLSFFTAIALLVALVITTRRRPDLRVLLPLLLAVAVSLAAQRNIALFALYALPLALADLLPHASARLRLISGLRERLRADDATAVTTVWVGAATVLLAIAAAVSRPGGPARLLPNEFSADVFPVEAVEYAREAGLTGSRVFHDYTWGGYILHQWPGQQIYIDGMANLFGSELMEEYAAIVGAEEGWEETLANRGITVLILSPKAPLATAALSDGTWQPLAQNSVTVLLQAAP
ncbi:MAG: hypothetical protein ABFS34_06140 [Gemmatimonadota bacterium]